MRYVLNKGATKCTDGEIEIRNWKELDGVNNDQFIISVMYDSLYVNSPTEDYATSYIRTQNNPSQILAWLRSFGFLVNYKPTPRLSKREMEFVKALILLGEEKIRRTYGDSIITVNECGAGSYINNTIQPLFAFIKIGETLYLKNLLKWEVEG